MGGKVEVSYLKQKESYEIIMSLRENLIENHYRFIRLRSVCFEKMSANYKMHDPIILKLELH